MNNLIKMLKKLVKLNDHQYLQLTQIIAIIGFFAIFILSISLQNLQFTHANPVPTNTGSLHGLTIGKGLHGHWLMNLFLIALLAMFPLGVILFIFSSRARKIFLKYFKVLIIWLLVLLGIRFIASFNQEESIQPEFSSTPSLPDILDPPTIQETSFPSALDTFTEPSSPLWLSYLIAFIISITLGLFVYFFWFAKRASEDDLKTITLKTIAEINQGRHWEDAIIECYAQMNTAIHHRKQIQRKRSLTPAEFAQELIKHGLPVESVQNLTQLFERARYGQYSSREEDRKLAVDYLEKITLALEAVE